MTTTYEVHPAAELFPLIQGADFATFMADIAANGQMEPIVIDRDGRVIDGRNRLRACEQLGLTPKTTVYDGTDVVQYVVSHNLHRRHLTDSQRAMIAARLAARGPGQRRNPGGQLPDTRELPPSAAEASALLGVSRAAVETAKRVVRNGTESLQSAAADGQVPVSTAARVADLPPDDQDEYVAKVQAGADPVKTAPPDEKQKRYKAKARASSPPPQRPTVYGTRRKHAAQLDALIIAIDGATSAFDGINALDASVNEEEATRLTGDLSKQIRSLNRINSLIKELTQS